MSPDDQDFAAIEELADADIAFADLHAMDAKALAKAQFAQALPAAVYSIIDLATNGLNERIKFDASKYIVDRVCGSGNGVGDEDPIEALLSDITNALGG